MYEKGLGAPQIIFHHCLVLKIKEGFERPESFTRLSKIITPLLTQKQTIPGL